MSKPTIDEILSDLHIRRCKIGDPHSNDVCAEFKSNFKQQLTQLVAEIIGEYEKIDMALDIDWALRSNSESALRGVENARPFQVKQIRNSHREIQRQRAEDLGINFDNLNF